MDMDEVGAFSRRYGNLPDDELRRIQNGGSDYRPEAREAARSMLAARAAAPADDPGAAAEPGGEPDGCAAEDHKRCESVVLAGIDIPFIDLVVLLVKLALAAIPAFIILWLIGAWLFWLFATLVMNS